MPTGFEAPAVKVLVDALLAALKKARTRKLKSNAQDQLSNAIRELLQSEPNLNQVDAALAVARAASIITNDLFVAENMRSTVLNYRSQHGPAGGKKVAKKTVKGKVASKKVAKKRTVKKTASKRG